MTADASTLEQNTAIANAYGPSQWPVDPTPQPMPIYVDTTTPEQLAANTYIANTYGPT